MRTRDPWSGGAQGVDGRYNARRSGAPGPHTHGNAVRQPAQPRYANYWAPLMHKRHLLQPAQHQCTNDGAPRTRKQHQQEHAAAADKTQRPDAACEGKNG